MKTEQWRKYQSPEKNFCLCVFKIEKQANIQDIDRSKEPTRNELSKDNSEMK